MRDKELQETRAMLTRLMQKDSIPKATGLDAETDDDSLKNIEVNVIENLHS